MGKSKSQEPKLVTRKRRFNKNFSSRGKIYKRPDRNQAEFPRQGYNNVYVCSQEYKQTYSRYPRKPYSSNQTHFKKKIYKKPPSRPSSPTLGSEEYMVRKIQQTSAIIMRQLLNPDEQIEADSGIQKNGNESKEQYSQNIDKNIEKTLNLPTETAENKNKKKITYNIEEIHQKIISHITNLNDGKKKNLVFSNTSNYDIIIQQIQKQKRLEISRALRNMCSQSKTQESSDLINSIIPDMGIKIEDLPRDLIEELSNNLNLNYEISSCEDDFVSVLSQDTGYCSLGESQKEYGESILSRNISFEEQPDLDAFIKPECTDEPLSLYDTVDSNVNYDNLKTNKDIENIAIKKEIDSYQEYNTEMSNNITETPPNTTPDTTKEMSENTLENTDRNTVQMKQELDQYAENTCNNSDLSNEDIKDLIPDINNLETGTTGMHLENNLPTNSESQNEMIKNEAKKEIEIIDNKLCNFHNQGLGLFNSKKSTTDVITQTDECCINTAETFFETFLIASSYKQPPKTISEAITRMLKIDEYISKLTEYRQTLFNNFEKPDESISMKTSSKICGNRTSIKNKKRKARKKLKTHHQGEIQHIIKKRKGEFVENSSNLKITPEVSGNVSANDNKNICREDHYEIENEADQKSSICDSVVEIKHKDLLHFPEVQEKMLVIQAVEDKLVAASESGKMFIYSLETGQCTNTLQISVVPITAVWFEKISQQKIEMYIGSFENNLKVYDFHTHLLLRTISIDDSIQCLESKWGYIFMGCVRGTLMRYSIKKNMLEYEDKFSDDRILVIKATYEGARRILLVGSRNSPVCIRDAMTGLYMRTMENIVSPTVYSLIMEKSLIYCGTTNHDILVYSFNDGKLADTYKITSSKGISCLKIIKNLLFASCHNGNIYVINIKSNQFVDVMEGPGGVILSMEVLENQVVVGTMSYKFTSLLIPQHILRYNCE